MTSTKAEKEASLRRAKMWSQSRRVSSTQKLTPAALNDKAKDTSPQARATRSHGKKKKVTVTVEEPKVKQETTGPLYRKTPSRSSRDEARARAQAWAAMRKGKGAAKKVRAEETAVQDEEMEMMVHGVPAVITTNGSNSGERDGMDEDEDFKTAPATIAKTSVTLKAPDLEELNRITTELSHACGRLAEITDRCES